MEKNMQQNNVININKNMVDEFYTAANTDVRANQDDHTHRLDFDSWASSSQGNDAIVKILGHSICLGKKKLCDGKYSYSTSYAGKAFIAYVAGLYFPCSMIKDDEFDFRIWSSRVGFRFHDEEHHLHHWDKLMKTAFLQGRKVAMDESIVGRYCHIEDWPSISLMTKVLEASNAK